MFSTTKLILRLDSLHLLNTNNKMILESPYTRIFLNKRNIASLQLSYVVLYAFNLLLIPLYYKSC